MWRRLGFSLALLVVVVSWCAFCGWLVVQLEDGDTRMYPFGATIGAVVFAVIVAAVVSALVRWVRWVITGNVKGN